MSSKIPVSLFISTVLVPSMERVLDHRGVFEGEHRGQGTYLSCLWIHLQLVSTGGSVVLPSSCQKVPPTYLLPETSILELEPR